MNLRFEADCSNRTFMELKYGKIRYIYDSVPSSNRTFMELKYHFDVEPTKDYSVLIAPLWN